MIGNGPTILNAPKIYNTGAGGIYEGRGVYNDGGINLEIEIDGYKYKCVKINNTIWINENLKANLGANKWYDNNPSYYEPLKCGLLYTYDSIAIIDNYLQNNLPGWRVANHDDYVNLFGLVEHASELKAHIDFWSGSLPGTDIFGFSAIPAGSYSIPVSTFQNFGIFCGWFTKELFSSSRAYVPTLNETDFVYPNNNSDIYSNMLPLRLCKDA
jgi:uncharacterized protein (TIGR02145 family)